MQAVILAAGMGTRLRPVTKNRSKAMAPVLGRPLVERALMPFFENGVRDFVFVVSAEDAEIRQYIGGLTGVDMTVRYVIQHERLGMAHALGLAAPYLDGSFALSSCDSLVGRTHVRELLAAARATEASLSLLDVDPGSVSRSAVVELDGYRVRRIIEKPAPEEAPSHTISLPHYVFSPRVLDLLPALKPSPRGEYELQDAIQGLIDGGGDVIGVRAAERLQVSTPEDLLSLTLRLFADDPYMREVQSTDVGHGTRLRAPYRVERGVVIGNNCEIGPGVFLENGCQICDGAVIRRSVVLRGGRVGEGETVDHQVVT